MARWSDARWKREFKNRLSQHDFHSIFLISPNGGKPTKIGCAKDTAARLLALQKAHWLETLTCCYQYLCPSKIEAEQLETYVQGKLLADGKHLRGAWFAIDGGNAASLIEIAARQLGIKIYSEREVEACFQQRNERELSEALKL